MKITPLQKKIIQTYGIAWLVSLVVLLAFHFGVVSSVSSELESLNSELATAQNEIASVRQIQGKENRKKFIDKLEKLHSELSAFVVDSDNWINIMPYISDTSEKIKVKMFASQDVSKGDFSEIAQCEKLGIKTIKVSFSSTFPRFASFVSSLERGTPVVFVEDFSISRSSGSNEPPNIDMKLNVLINTTGSLTLACDPQQTQHSEGI